MGMACEFMMRCGVQLALIAAGVVLTAAPRADAQVQGNDNSSREIDLEGAHLRPPWFLQLMPTDCLAVAQVSFTELAKYPASRPIYEAIKSNPGYREKYGISPRAIRDMTVMLSGRSFETLKSRIVIRTRSAITDETIKWGGLADFDVRRSKEGMYQLSKQGVAWRVFDRNAIVLDDPAGMEDCMAKQFVRHLPWNWLEVDTNPATKSAWIAVSPEELKRFLEQEPGDPLVQKALALKGATSIIMGVGIADKLTLHMKVGAKDVDATKQIEALARDALKWIAEAFDAKGEVHEQSVRAAVALLRSAEVAPLIDELATNAELACDGNRIVVSSSAPFDVEQCRRLVRIPTRFVETVAPLAVDERPERAMIASAHNLDALARGMFRYYRANSHLPPASVLGPDGRTLHSWRVALLPYLDEDDLYRQYKLDEPWDSQHNSKLLEQAPDVFRAADEEPDSVDTCYFVLSGEDTLFANGSGTAVAEEDNPALHSILIVESRRGVPWTKPVDVPFDAEAPFPKLGGIHKDLFLCILADGRIVGYPPDNSPAELKAMAIKTAEKPKPAPNAGEE